MRWLFDAMSLCETIPHEKSVRIVHALLSAMCATNDLLIMLASAKLWEMPKDWLVKNIEEILVTADATQCNINDEYDYCRMYDAVSHIPELREIVIRIGLGQENPEVRSLAAENEKRPEQEHARFFEYTTNHMKYLHLL